MRNNYVYEAYSNPFINSDNYSTKKNEFETSPSGPQISPYKTYGGFNSLMHLNTSTQKPPYTGSSYPTNSSNYQYSKNYPETSNIYEANRTKYRSPATTTSTPSVPTITPNKDFNIYSTPSQPNKQREIAPPTTYQDQTPPKNFKTSEPHSATFYSPNRTNARYENPSEADQGINRPLFYNSDPKRLVVTKANSTNEDVRYKEDARTEPRSSIASNAAFDDSSKYTSRSIMQDHHEIISSKLKPYQATLERDKKDGIRRYIIPTTIEKTDSSINGIKLKDSTSPLSFSSLYPDINSVHRVFQDRYKATNFLSPTRTNTVLNPSIPYTKPNDLGKFESLPIRNMPIVSNFDTRIYQDIEKRNLINNSRSSKPVQVDNPKPKERSVSPTDFGVDEEVTENDDTRPNPHNSERPSVDQSRYSLTEKLGNYTKKQINHSSRNKISVSASKPNFPQSPDAKLNTEENLGKREKLISSADRERGRSSSFDRKSSSSNKDKGMSPLRDLYESTKNLWNRMVYRDRVKCNCSPNLLHDDETCTRARNWLYTKYNPNELEYLKKTYNQVLETVEIDPKCARQIGLDIPRTFPSHKLFARDSEGSKSLERVLKTYAKYDPHIGYVQGLNFVAASIMYHAEEYITFWILVILFERIEIRDVYTKELSGVYKHGMILDALIKQRLPDLYNKMNEYGVSVQMFCIEWVCGLFGSIIPIETMGVFLDQFIENGWKFFYTFVVSLLLEFEEVFSKTEDLSEMMIIFKNSINRGSNDGGKLKISWEKIVENTKNIEINSDIIFKLHAMFDVETKNFQGDPSELLSKL